MVPGWGLFVRSWTKFMTPQEIKAAIAEKVFGWQHLTGKAAWDWHHSQKFPPQGPTHQQSIHVLGNEVMACQDCGLGIPDYCGDIALACNVIDRLRQLWVWEIQAVENIYSIKMYLSQDVGKIHRLTVRTQDVSLPMAICVAALRSFKALDLTVSPQTHP